MTKTMFVKITATMCSGLVLSALTSRLAFAVNGPAPIKYNFGQLGEYSISGGVDGYGTLYNNGAGNLFNQNPQNVSVGLTNALVTLQKISGLVQFTFEAGEYTFPILGSKSFEYPTGSPQNAYNFLGTPVLQGYVTLVPSPDFSISAGIIPTVEGLESGQDWNNSNFFLSQLANMEITSERGVEATLTHGPAILTVQLDDGYFSKRFNNFQGALTYNLNSTDYLYLYGSNTFGTTDFTNVTNGFPEVNSNMIGGGVFTHPLSC
ncbi:outer membrane beta-barrel protein [Acidiphilium multivorum]|uniref:outer membrane beta-barrel protein n=1 Tax=Acidiphilium multivorum TaxID=62140 RepID=UPI001B8C90CD|nr:outer membrane beta-barrel protein [Acidiphilium multivorum]MBS3025649.1 outer membrane beta-barrel protein [Acidiphilium multivorum]